MVYIYDLEVYPNFFLASFKSLDGKYYEYEISDRKNEIKDLRTFLYQDNLQLVGFNNVNFDYPVLHKSILSNNNDWSAIQIYNIMIDVINEEYSSIWDNQVKIPQLDLYRIWHYDNKNKRTSLKWLEFAMRMENIQDLPYKPGTYLNNEEMDVTLKYCRNDLDATHKFFLLSIKHIKIREFYSNLEGINLMNASETKIAKDVFGKYLSKDMGVSYKELRQMRTNRAYIPIKDIIFPYINFKHKQNIEVLEYFKNTIWKQSADGYSTKISYSIDYLNIKREFGEGGLHSFGKPGIYESNDEYMVYDLDFASYYPHLSFKNKLHPAHIPEKVFSEKYEGFYKERKNYPKSDPRNYVLKIVLNSAYGLSKDKYSYLYDPKWQLSITINGQLLLAMLTESVIDSTTYCVPIFENTDGAAYIIKRSEKHLVDEVCKRMESLSGIAIEAQECKKLIMRDVNNYINIISDDNVKFKGAYEIDRDFHKNHSKRIVAIAAANYFINGVPPNITIDNHLNYTDYTFGAEYINHGVYDFCIGNKSKFNNKLFKRTRKGTNIIDTELGKVNRYYVSNSGNELIKKLPPLEKNFIGSTDKVKSETGQINIFDFIEDVKVDPKDRESNIEAGYFCTLFNIYNEDEYDINYNYYYNEANKLILSIVNNL